jgi:hypothetical protein
VADRSIYPGLFCWRLTFYSPQGPLSLCGDGIMDVNAGACIEQLTRSPCATSRMNRNKRRLFEAAVSERGRSTVRIIVFLIGNESDGKLAEVVLKTAADGEAQPGPRVLASLQVE